MKGPLHCRLVSRLVDTISRKLVSLRHFIPTEFARKTRSLSEVDRWKATEFRQFLLYTGPVALAKNLPHTIYMNFLLFHVGITILASPILSSLYCDFAGDLLKSFVQHFGQLYGSNMLVYNVHGLVHLAADVKQFGTLDNFSAFPFENFLCSLKKMVRKPKFPLEQVVRRMSEFRSCHAGRQSNQKELPQFSNEHLRGPVPVGFVHCKQYRKLCIGKFTISTDLGNNCAKVDGQIVLIENILFNEFEKNGFFVARKCQSTRDFYTYPLASSNLGIYQVSFQNSLVVVPQTGFETKYMILPNEDGTYVAFPLSVL